MNLGIIASHDCTPIIDVAGKVAAAIVLAHEDGGMLHIRRKARGEPSSPIEQLAYDIQSEVGGTSVLHGTKGPDREDVYDRDWLLVKSIDRLIAFFAPGRVMEGGTGHVVHAALTRGVKVEAWEAVEAGTIRPVGSDDGYHVDDEGVEWMERRFEEWREADIERQVMERLNGSPSYFPYTGGFSTTTTGTRGYTTTTGTTISIGTTTTGRPGVWTLTGTTTK